MRKIILLIYLIFPLYLNAQFLYLFNIDKSQYPSVSANFFAFDSEYNLISGIQAEDCQIKENGSKKEIIELSEEKNDLKQISVILLVDVSNSMEGNNLKFMKAVLKKYITYTPFTYTSMALVSFNHDVYVSQDFTRDKKKLINAVNNLKTDGGTNYDIALYKKEQSALNILKSNFSQESAIIFVTDGLSSVDTATVIKLSNQTNTKIYTVALNMPLPASLKSIARNTYAQSYEVYSMDEALQAYLSILMNIYKKYYKIKWISQKPCNKNIYIDLDLPQYNLHTNSTYTIKESQTTGIYSDKQAVIFDPLSDKTEQKFSLYTYTPIKITDLSIKDTSIFKIAYNFELPVILDSGKTLDIEVIRKKTNRQIYERVEINTNKCKDKRIYLYNGIPALFVLPGAMKVTSPNGGETFYRGEEINITWKSKSNNKTNVFYSLDSGKTYTYLTTTYGHSHYWPIYAQPSNECKIKITEEKKPIIFLNNKGYVKQLELSEYGNKFSALIGKEITYGLLDGSILSKYAFPKGIKNFKITDNEKIVILTEKNDLIIIDLNYKDSKKHTVIRSRNLILNYFILNNSDQLAVLYKNNPKLIIYDIKTGHKDIKIKLNRIPKKVASNGQILSIISGSHWLIYDLSKKKQIDKLDNKSERFRMSAVSTDGKKAIAITYNNTLYLWDISKSYSKGIKLQDNTDYPTKIAVNTDGTILLLYNQERLILMRDSNKIFDYKANKKERITNAVFSSNNKEMIYSLNKTNKNGTQNNILSRFDLSSNRVLPKNSSIKPKSAIKEITFSKAANILGYTTEDGNYIITMLPDAYSVAGDVSDNIFKIKSYSVSVKDTVYLPEVYTHQNISHNFENFFSNTNNQIAAIDRIILSNQFKKYFSIISGFPPKSVGPYKSSNLEIGFKGMGTPGIYKAPFLIISGEDTLKSVVKVKVVKLPVTHRIEERYLGEIKLTKSLEKEFKVFRNITNDTIIIDSIVEQRGDNSTIILKKFDEYIYPNKELKVNFAFIGNSRGKKSSVYHIYIKKYKQPLEFIVRGEVLAPKYAKLKCNAYNILTKQPANCYIYYYDTETHLLIDSVKSNRGKIELNIPTELSYKFTDKAFTDSAFVNLKKVINDTVCNIKLNIVCIKDGMRYRLKNVNFRSNSYSLSPKLRQELNTLVYAMNKYPNFSIIVEGHTDDEGPYEYNLALGKKRALSVKNYLVYKGIASERIKVKSYGSSKPISDFDKSKNRRIEIIFIKQKK